MDTPKPKNCKSEDWDRSAQRVTSHLAARQGGLGTRLNLLMQRSTQEGKSKDQPK